MSLDAVKQFIHVNDLDLHGLRGFDLFVKGKLILHSMWFNKIEDAYSAAKDDLYADDPLYPDEDAYIVAQDANLKSVYIQMEGSDPIVKYMTPYLI